MQWIQQHAVFIHGHGMCVVSITQHSAFWSLRACSVSEMLRLLSISDVRRPTDPEPRPSAAMPRTKGLRAPAAAAVAAAASSPSSGPATTAVAAAAAAPAGGDSGSAATLRNPFEFTDASVHSALPQYAEEQPGIDAHTSLRVSATTTWCVALVPDHSTRIPCPPAPRCKAKQF